MEKLYKVKRRRFVFWVCKWESGLNSIDRITKGFGGSVVFRKTLGEIESYIRNNGYKMEKS